MGKKRRTRIFVGDVHGCLDELGDLLEALSYDRDRHDLWFVGDLVNRGPESRKVLKRVRKLGAGVVVGNHDLHLIGRAAGARNPRAGDTLDDLLRAKDCNKLVDWLRDQPVLQRWEDILLVHAGLHPRWSGWKRIGRRLEAALRSRPDPLRDRDLAYATRVRLCDPRGRQPRKRELRGGIGKAPYAPWDSWYRGKRIVVFGHWAQRGMVIDKNVRGLDTGCVYGGALTAWVAETDELISVPARRQYVTPGSD